MQIRVNDLGNHTLVDNRIAELVSSLRDQREQMAALSAESDTARDELRRLLELRGENWSDDDGYARLVPESTRASYEVKSLDALILRDPLQYGWLKDYRKLSTIRSTVQVK